MTPKATKISIPAPSASAPVSLPQPVAVDRVGVEAVAPAATAEPVPAAAANLPGRQDFSAAPATALAPVLTPTSAPAMVAAPAPQPAAAAGVVESVLSPLPGNGTGAPTQSPMSWVMLAAARRELEANQTAPAPAATVSRAQSAAPAAALTLEDFILEMFGIAPTPPPVNNPPVIDSISVKPYTSGNAGDVAITVNASDPNGDKLTYKVSTDLTKGGTSNARNRAGFKLENVFRYTPYPVARHAAAKLGAPVSDTTDTVTVTVTDAQGASTTQTVTVPISPTNNAPTGANLLSGTSWPGTPANVQVFQSKKADGVIPAQVIAVDLDLHDKVTFTLATTPTMGTVELGKVNPGGVPRGSGGTRASLDFTYTPSQEARHAAAKLGANGNAPADKYDSFTVTVADEYGGKQDITAKVLVKPLNTAPTTQVEIGTPNPADGIVSGAVKATDAENDTLTYKLTNGLNHQPLRGTVTVNADGSFAYTPRKAARTLARSTPMSDAFDVTVADGYGGTTVQNVKVTVEPFNSAPVAGKTTSTTNAVTGVVTGKLSATDAENDPLTYTAPTTTTAKGTVVVAADGAFTYTPTQAARHNAARTGAQPGDKADTFTATVSDNYGATTSIPVSVTITPSNATPVANATVGTPDPGTGVVTGYVVATDADLDSLTYSGPTTTTKGKVTVGTDGKLTYRPSDAARDAAAGANASAADQTDAFTITVDDGHGGSTAVPVSVAVSPAVPLAGIDGIQSSDVSEGNAGLTVSLLKVKLSRASADPVVVSYQIADSGSATPGVDFIAESGSVGFAPGQTETVIPVKVIGDTTFESDESIGVTLTGAFNAKVVNGNQDGLTDHFNPVIKNDDAPPVPVSVSVGFDTGQSPNLTEGDSGTTVNPLTVKLSGPSAQTVTVSYSFVDTGQATPGVDFVAAPGTVVFAPGQTVATIPVGVVGDTDPEGDESLQVVLISATNANVVEGTQDGLSATFIATIINDDNSAA